MTAFFRIILLQVMFSSSTLVSLLEAVRMSEHNASKAAVTEGYQPTAVPATRQKSETNEQEITMNEEKNPQRSFPTNEGNEIREDNAREKNKTSDTTTKQPNAVQESHNAFVDTPSSPSKPHDLTFAANCDQQTLIENETTPSISNVSSSCRSAEESVHDEVITFLENSKKRYLETSEFVKRHYLQNGIWSVDGVVILKMWNFNSCSGRCGRWFKSPCSCSYHCLIYDNCCLDFLDVCSDSLKDVDRVRRIYQIAGNVRCFLDEGGSFMVFRCPGDAEDDCVNGTKQQHTGLRAFQEAFENAPVTDIDTGFIFKSRSIFNCYADVAIPNTAWSPLVSVQSRHRHSSDLDKTTTQVLNFSDVVYRKPLSVELHSCNYAVLDYCPEGYPDEEIKRQCDSGPIGYINAFNGNLQAVKNIACVHCNIDSLRGSSPLSLQATPTTIIIRSGTVLRALMDLSSNSVRLSSYQSPGLLWKSMVCTLEEGVCSLDSCRQSQSKVAEYCWTEIGVSVGVSRKGRNTTVADVKNIAEDLLCYLKEMFVQGEIIFPLKGMEKPIDVYATPENFIIFFAVASHSSPSQISCLGDDIARYLVSSYYQGRLLRNNILKPNDSTNGSSNNDECTGAGGDSYFDSTSANVEGRMNVTNGNVEGRMNVTNGNVEGRMNVTNGNVGGRTDVCPEKKEDRVLPRGCHFTTSINPHQEDSESENFPVCTVFYKITGTLQPEDAINLYCSANNVKCINKNVTFSLDRFTCDPKNRVASHHVGEPSSKQSVKDRRSLNLARSNQASKGEKATPLHGLKVRILLIISYVLSVKMWR